jgi:hypothetical protein
LFDFHLGGGEDGISNGFAWTAPFNSYFLGLFFDVFESSRVANAIVSPSFESGEVRGELYRDNCSIKSEGLKRMVR